MSSSFGQVFRISTWGESHGTGVGVVIDGCPSLVPVTEEDIQRELDRRRPGQSDIVTPRREEDRAEILSGVLDGKTLGTPIAISVRNKDHRSSAYDEMARTYRPSHADYTSDAKYGIRAWAGGGRASARETIGRVAAGAVARAVLKQAFPDMEVVSTPTSCAVAPSAATTSVALGDKLTIRVPAGAGGRLPRHPAALSTATSSSTQRELTPPSTLALRPAPASHVDP